MTQENQVCCQDFEKGSQASSIYLPLAFLIPFFRSLKIRIDLYKLNGHEETFAKALD